MWSYFYRPFQAQHNTTGCLESPEETLILPEEYHFVCIYRYFSTKAFSFFSFGLPLRISPAMISASGEVYKLVCDNNGEKTAQVMFVVGTDEGGLKHAGWKNNLNFAVKCQKRANELFPNIVRPINLRTERFNQHTTGASIIVEVGTNGNTLEEAISSAKITAQAISDVIKTY